MTRALQEALEYALAVQPDLMEEGTLKQQFPALIRSCIIAANEIRLGNKSEKDLPMMVYGKEDVPRSTLQRLLTRAQRELERITVEASPDDSDGFTRLPWMSVLHLYSAGISAYVGSKDYRARERLSSVMSAAKDPYMLPMSISAGVLLTLHMAQHDKPSRMAVTRQATRRAIDDFLDSWEWISIYAELLSIVRRRYGMKVRRTRILEIKSSLDTLLEDGLKGMAPQAQMIAALCAYMVGQFEDNASTIVRWAEVYRRSSMAVDRTSKLYQRTSRRMSLRAYMVARDYASAIPLLEEILSEEYSSSRARNATEYATYIAWLSRGLLTQGRYRDALNNLNGIDSLTMKSAPENVRRILLMYRAIALPLASPAKEPFDRRLLRTAILRNETSSRRASQHHLRLGALVALLIHLGTGGTAGEITMKEVAERLLMMVNFHAQLRACARTTAFIRAVAVLERVEHLSVAQVHRLVAVKRQLQILADTKPDYDLEVVPYEEIIERLYTHQIRELHAQRDTRRTPRQTASR